MFRTRILPLLQLCRFAAVFTALSDICAGLAMSGQLTPWKWANTCLLGSSACLYLSGMVLNDYFDRQIDAVERPKRPIPSGRISASAALSWGVGLMITGWLLAGGAAFAPGQTAQPLVVATILSAAILAYDGGGKSWAIGPVLMGSCRFLNVLLGASLVSGDSIGWFPGRESFVQVWSDPQICVAGALWVYITGVTLFARNEAGESSRSALTGALVVVNAGLALLALYLGWSSHDWSRSARSMLGLGLVAVVINRAGRVAWKEPSPRNVQFGVRTMLSWLILIDATVVFFWHPDPRAAIAVALLLWPAKLIGRSLAIT